MSDSEVPEAPRPERGKVALPPSCSDNGIVQIINAIADRVDPLIKVVTAIAERALQAKVADTRFRVHMAWVAVLIVALIVGVASWLTYAGKLDGSTYGFLLGLIVGYVLTFVRDAIRPPKEDG